MGDHRNVNNPSNICFEPGAPTGQNRGAGFCSTTPRHSPPRADCCDGSDENSGKCPNTCAEAGAASRAALKARATALKQGLKNREKYVSKAVMGRSEWQQELAKVSQEAEGLQRVVSRLQGAQFCPVEGRV